MARHLQSVPRARAPERFALPQVASSPAIQPVRPDPPGRPAAASDESSGSFGGMLDASAGSGAARADARQAMGMQSSVKGSKRTYSSII